MGLNSEAAGQRGLSTAHAQPSRSAESKRHPAQWHVPSPAQENLICHVIGLRRCASSVRSVSQPRDRALIADQSLYLLRRPQNSRV